MQVVYLICFERPYRHARHYLGWTNDLEHRMEKHLRGQGSPLIRAAIGVGIAVTLARVWPDADRNFESRLKRRKEGPRLCPRCTANPRPRAA
jgi:hypothetical protein